MQRDAGHDRETEGAQDVDRTLSHQARLVLVSGKGGVGKSTCAAALALAAVDSGQRVCLVEVEGRQTMARLFGTRPWDFTEREVRPGLWGLSIDPDASLAEYLEQFYGARRLSKLVVGSTAVEFATTAAPGIKDVLLIGKIADVERRQRDGKPGRHYDVVVVDAPPTGRLVSFLRAPEATTHLVSVGPIRNQAQRIVDLLVDHERTVLHLATLYEELPVQETLEAVEALEGLGVQIGAILANKVLDERLAAEEVEALASLDDAAVQRIVARAGLDLDGAGVRALRRAHADEAARLDQQEKSRAQLLEGLGRHPVVELGLIESPRFGEEELRRLAGTLADPPAATPAS